MMDHKAVFVDTWGWMALGHRRDPRHKEVKRIYRELRSHQVLTEDEHFIQVGMEFSKVP